MNLKKTPKPKPKRNCKTCDFHDDFSWVCCNGDSPYCADFTDDEDACEAWEKKRREQEEARSEAYTR